jgi:long-subunit fatty acid transport protein
MKKSALLVILTAVVCLPGQIQAGGYDTPILYSARHMGMGGAAISYVNDPSALFHNPAGLGHTKFITATVDFSPLLGEIVSTPGNIKAKDGLGETYDVTNVKSETVLAPFFLVAGAFRVTDWMTLGIGAYPVASAGAGYRYPKYSYSEKANQTIDDRTKIAFIEVAPGVAFNLPGNLRLGATYRATILTFERYQGALGGDKPSLDMDMKGVSFAGFKVGLQWQPLPWLQAGLVYRHETKTTVKADTAQAYKPFSDVSMGFTLPSKLGGGIRGDLPFGLGISADLEYGFNSQNDVSYLKGTDDTGKINKVPNQFRWNNGITFRGGLEYGLPIPVLGMKLRAGYVYDGKTSNEKYPSAFGTPPAATQVITAGLGTGFKLGKVGMEVNLAYAYRFGAVEVTEADVDAGTESCPFCSSPGDYDLKMHGIYVDTSLYF